MTAFAREQQDDQEEWQQLETRSETLHMDQAERWPALPYEAWRETCQTLHMWTQIVGKVRLELSPFLNHWWHVALYVTPRGLTTSAIPYHGGSFDVTFDFLEHTLFIRTSEGTTKALPLIPRSVAAFYQWLRKGESSRRTLPTICVHMCSVWQVSRHAS